MFLDLVKSNILFEYQETNFLYRLKFNLQGNVDRNNLHVYIENREVIVETRKDTKETLLFKTVNELPISVLERSILYIRRSIAIPADVDQFAITCNSIGDNVDIDLPKLCWMAEQSED